MYSICIDSDQSSLEQVELLSYLIVSENVMFSSQLRYNIKFVAVSGHLRHGDFFKGTKIKTVLV